MCRAIYLIESALKPMIEAGRKIDRLVMYVSAESSWSDIGFIKTNYGPLRICTNPYMKLGTSYIMEEPGKKGRAFSWVTRRELQNEKIKQ